MPDSDTGAVESDDAEVAKVVELVLEHATERPRESLMVITASERHAVRVNQAVLAAFAKRTELADFILERPRRAVHRRDARAVGRRRAATASSSRSATGAPRTADCCRTSARSPSRAATACSPSA